MANKGASGGSGSGRKRVVEAVKPWGRDAAWWVLAIEAVVAIGLGIYVLTQLERASNVLTYALSIFLVVDGVLGIFNSLRGIGKTFGAMRAGISLLGGLIVLLMPILNFGNPVTAGWILGLAFLASGLLGLLAQFFERRGRRLSWMGVLVTALMMLLGLVYIFSLATQNATVLIWLGWLLLAVGIMLGIYAAFVWSQSRSAGAGAAV